MKTNSRIKYKICYVVMCFPKISETFIAEEAASLYDFKVEPLLLSVFPGEFAITHKSANKLIDSGNVTYLRGYSLYDSILAIAYLFLKQPKTTLKGLGEALGSGVERWRYIQVLPYAALLVKENVHHIHAHFADKNFLYANILSDWTNIPFGVTTHRYDLLEDLISSRLLNKLYNKSKIIVTISKFNQELMVKKYGIPSNKISIVHCGIRLNQFTPSKSNNRANQIINLINIGRLVHVKGQKILIEALNLCKKKGVMFNLRIIGEGPLHAQLSALTSRFDLTNSVQLVGSQSQEQIIKELDNADAYIMPSLSEGIPVSCMEAMAMELPVIATRITGLSELIEDHISGVLIEPNNVNALADSLIWLASHEKERNQLGINARKKIEDDFERNNSTKELLRLWRINQ